MEFEDDGQSNQSHDTGSPASPDQNSRITVTVAEAPPEPPQDTLALALPAQQPRSATNGSGGGGGGGGGGREDCWTEEATSVLIEAWGERYLELSRGNLKQKHWKEVAEIVGSREDYTKTRKTDVQCKNRIDTVKKKYKLEKSKIESGGGPSKWSFFKRMDYLIGPTPKVSSSALQKVPIGIPVGVRSAPHGQKQQKQKQKMQFRKAAPVDSDSSDSDREQTPDSVDSFPPETVKRQKIQREINSNPLLRCGTEIRKNVGELGEGKELGNSIKELSRAILKFGQVYEKTETSKLQQMVEMEKQRMKFAKDLELQRMQFFMKTQVEISEMKLDGRRDEKNLHNINNNNSKNHNRHKHNHSDSN